MNELLPSVSDYIDKGEYSLVISNVDYFAGYPDISFHQINQQTFSILIKESVKDFEHREYRIPFEVVSIPNAPPLINESGMEILPLILGVLGLITLYFIISEIRKTSESVITPIVTSASSYMPLILIGLFIVFVIPKLKGVRA